MDSLTLLNTVFEDMDRERKECDEKMPKAKQIQKRKFLCAIGKESPSPTEDDDEEFLKGVETKCVQMIRLVRYRYRSDHWSDSVATDRIKKILEEHQNFDLNLYLNCTKTIYLTYSDRCQHTSEVYKAFTYVLTHARSFDDPSQNLFHLQPNGSFRMNFKDTLNPLPDSIYMKKIAKLIEALRMGYDETKFRILNVNVSYLTLLILRRCIKDETQFFEVFNHMKTHDDYVKLCPHPLNNQLPRIGPYFNKAVNKSQLNDSVHLALYAFLTGEEADNTKTKRILRATCIQHIEWTGLQLPFLFFKVVSLYGIEVAALWDSLAFELTTKSLFRLADDYYKQYKKINANPPETSKWFPYCRVLNGDYHRDLSASENKDLCMVLAYLVDLKKGFNKSFVRNSHWAKNNKKLEQWLDVAKAIHELYED